MTRFPVFPFAEFMALGLRSTLMMAEAQAVMAMRIAGMAGMWRVSPKESERMFSEKLEAAQESGLAVTRAVLSGKPPLKLAEAALKPIKRRTGANAKRLAKAGPKTP